MEYSNNRSTGILLDFNLGCRVATLLKSLFRTLTSMLHAYKFLRTYLKCSWDFLKFCFWYSRSVRILKKRCFQKERKSLKKYTITKKHCYSEIVSLLCFYIHSSNLKFKMRRFAAFFRKFWSLVPAETGRKLNVHKTFRIRPGRLLNVLCTFNLRPVSTGVVYFHMNAGRKLNVYKTLTSYLLSIYVLCPGGWPFRSSVDVIY